MLPSAHIQCPYCGETIEVVVDAAIGDDAGSQHYIEDCQVCCRPIAIAVSLDADGDVLIRASAENDA